MKRVKTLIGSTYHHFMEDSLRRNSLFLIMSQAISAGAAFVFWIICAHLFAPKEVGLATSFISFGGLVSAFTNLGLPNTIIRFLPVSKQKSGIFVGAITALLITSLAGSLIAVLIIGQLSSKLAFVQHSMDLVVLLFLLVMGNTISGLLDGTLLAYRKSEYILGKAIIVNIPKIILPFLFVSFALKGIVSIYVILLIIGIVYNLYVLLVKLLPKANFKPQFKELVEHKSYAASNYFGGMLGVLPGTLVPIIVLNRLGAEQAAFFYMAMQISSFLNVISSSTSQALMAESSQSNETDAYRTHLLNALRSLYRLLGLAIVVVIAVGWPVLRVYGKSYASFGYAPLVILSFASVFVAVNWLGDTLLNIQRRPRAYFWMNGFNAVAVVAAIYLFASHGLIAVSVGWLIAQFISAAVYLLIFARDQAFGLLPRANSS